MPARQVVLHVTVVVPDATPVDALVAGLAGRELPAVPGSWIASAHRITDCGADTEPEVDDFAEVLEAEADADAGLVDLD